MLPATDSSYDPRRAAYDLRKLRGEELLRKVPDSRCYFIPQQAVWAIAALVNLREKILRPILAGVGKPKMGRKPKNWSSIDQHYEAVPPKTCSHSWKTCALPGNKRQSFVDTVAVSA
jgi:hypothetical protein